MTKVLIAAALLSLLGIYTWLNLFYLNSLSVWFNLSIDKYVYFSFQSHLFQLFLSLLQLIIFLKFTESQLRHGSAISWFPALFFLFRFLTAHTALTGRTGGICFILFSLLLSGYALYNARAEYDFKTVRISRPRIPESLKIALLADLHFDSHTKYSHVKKVVDAVKASGPDITVISGDFLNSKVDIKILSPFNELENEVLLVTGNHDRAYADDAKYVDSLSRVNIRPLRNDVYNFKGVQFLGIDFSLDSHEKNFSIIENQPAYSKTFFRVLLSHEPSDLEFFSKRKIDLMLSGHTHNGQIFPFNFFVRLVYEKTIGLCRINDMTLYITQGTGTWGPKMRLGSRNEITLIKLEKSENIENKYLTLLKKSI